MYFWIPYAFVRIVVFFIAGILIGIYFPNSIPVYYTIPLLIVTVVVFFLLAFFSSHWKGRFNPGLAALLAIFLAGYLNVHLRDQSQHDDHLLNLHGSPSFYRAVVTSAAHEKLKTWKAEASIEEVNLGGTWRTCKGNIILYLSREDFQSPVHYGDVVLIKGSPQIVRGPGNPGEFDYQQFLAYQSIYHQHFLRRDDVMIIGNDAPNVFMKFAIDTCLWAEGVLNHSVSGEREKGIASALVLGVTDGLDRELMGAYGATGTLHVLAVSGLHISIIYMIILWILTPLNKSVRGKWIVAAISLFILWTYAFVTGLSPSVLRAVTMFTFVALAKPWKQRVNIYNTLGASAFFLLLFEPTMIMSVGFQLSYLAVLGIVYIQPKLYDLWEPESRIWDEIWKVTSVSIAAQIATLPLGLLYFHQFPNYFIISNLLVIPASFIVLIAGLLVLATSFIPVVAAVFGWLVMWVIKIMNLIVFTIEKVPFSLTDNISITPLQGILIAGIIIAVLLLLERRQFSYLVITCLLIVSYSLIQWETYFRNSSTEGIMVYDVTGHSAIDFIDHGAAIFVADSAMLHDEQKMKFHIQPARLLWGIEDVSVAGNNVRNVDGGYFVLWKNKSLLVVNEKLKGAPQSVKVDYVIISNNAVRDLDALKNIETDLIIVDSSNSLYLAKKLEEQARQKKIELYAVPCQGNYQQMISI